MLNKSVDYGSKIYGSAEKYLTLRIELDGNVEAKWALQGIDLNKGEVVSHEGNTIIAKFPYTVTGNKGKKQQHSNILGKVTKNVKKGLSDVLKIGQSTDTYRKEKGRNLTVFEKRKEINL